ncbi:hypothetical protein [Streptomyces sp. Je 1-369]|uniref:hypothetical protein n=1 Tax=Streptomyces sp. Je 1-369 TaxID=2966192 RepID=UPI002285E460|nr:hypothetical protein [Streptomyces sp. Je 1-369]WAL93935.1 hypothetical protein NOO62_05150 [Streptomyces sp. Je 1-369]
MWGLTIRRRRDWLVHELHARLQRAEAERDAALTAAAEAEAAAIRTAGRNTILAEQVERLTAAEAAHDADIEEQADRIDRLIRACVRYRADLARGSRDLTRLQTRLDDVLGLTAPAVEAGANWQKRRSDTFRGGVA